MRGKKATQLLCILVVVSGLSLACSRDGRLTLARQHIHAGNSYLSEGKLKLGLAEFELAREIAPHHLPIHLQIGSLQTRLGRYSQAVETFQLIIKRDPENAQAHSLWAKVLAKQGRLPKAAEKYEKAAALDSELPDVWGQWGMVLVSLGRNAEAVEVFERMEGLDSEPRARPLSHWGTALHHLGRKEEAVKKYEAALELDPESFNAINNLGVLLVRSGAPKDRERGIELLRGGLKQRAGSPTALHNLGWAYIQEGDFSEAHDLLQRAVAATDTSSRLYKERLRDLERAREGLPRTDALAAMPNIVLVVIDTLRADHLGSYGYARKTPNIDRLAAEGLVFENAISQAPWTAASVGSLFTGLYPSVHGLDGGIEWGPGQRTAGGKLPFAIQRTLKSGQLTVAEGLRRSGYRTAGFVSNVYVNSIFGFSQGFETYDDEHRDYSKDVAKVKRRGENTNEHVFRWLDSGPEEPFFLFVHYNDPHWPYNPPAPFGKDYVSGYQGELTPERSSIVEQQGKPITSLSAEDLAYLIGLYDGEIAYADSNAGKLLQKLDRRSTDRGLVTVLTADHGEEFLDHGSASHGYTLYEEQIHVPLVIRFPGTLKPGRLQQQVRLIDVMPTLFDLAGVQDQELYRGLQGESLVPLMLGKTPMGPGDAFSEATYAGEQKSVRTQDGLKLIHSFSDGHTLLFDLKADPQEKKSLLEAEAKLGTPLRSSLDDFVKTNEGIRLVLYGDGGGDQEIVLDAETQDRLKALGYIQ